jgi:hypothetical protein
LFWRVNEVGWHQLLLSFLPEHVVETLFGAGIRTVRRTMASNTQQDVVKIVVPVDKQTETTVSNPATNRDGSA